MQTEENTPQLLTDEPERVYHARKEVSGSMLNDFAVSPFHYFAKYAAATPWIENELSDALTMGSAVHVLTQEPQNWKKRFYVAPDIRRGTTEWKHHEKVAGSREILKSPDAHEAAKMALAFRMNKSVQENVLAHEGVSECTVLWTDAETGIRCRGRLDRLSIAGQYVADFKTAADASPRKFQRSIIDFRYHVKAAFYLDGLVATGDRRFAGAADWSYLWPVVEKGTYAVALYAASGDMIRRGRELYKNELRRLAGCLKRNEWPAYTENIGLLDLPEWATRDFNPSTEVAI